MKGVGQSVGNTFAEWAIKGPILSIFWPDSASTGITGFMASLGIDIAGKEEQTINDYDDMLLENELARSEKLEEESRKQEEETQEQNNKNNEEDEKQSSVAKFLTLPEITGNEYSEDQLCDFSFLTKNFYTITSATYLEESDMPVSEMLAMDMSIEGENTSPQILIYHTHSQEAFSDSTGDDMSIVAVGNYLTELLKSLGYNVIHNTDTYDLTDGKLDRNSAYEKARNGISKVLEENPTVEVVLDIHRDGVNDDVYLATDINGKRTAQVMFFNGISRLSGVGDIDYLYNPYLTANLALSLQMKLASEAYYPGFARKNYINAYKYNLDLRPKSMLIEVGAQTNTFEEAKNAMEPLAVLLDYLFKQ
ncbi:MAG: stage II sporulation protein P [Eubacterium sp.]